MVLFFFFCGVKLQEKVLHYFCVLTFLGMIQLCRKRPPFTLTYKTKHGDSFSELKLEYFWKGHAVVFGVLSKYLFRLIINSRNKGETSSLYF